MQKTGVWWVWNPDPSCLRLLSPYKYLIRWGTRVSTSSFLPVWSIIQFCQFWGQGPTHTVTHASFRCCGLKKTYLVISVPQLCAYIFAILFEFSGIYNRHFRLNFLYSRRNTALSIESWCTAFVTSPPWGRLMPAMSSEHVTVGPIEDAVSGRHALLCFRLNSEMRWTNWRVARHLPTVPNQAEHVTFATTDHFIISPTPPVKNITIYGSNRSPLVRSSF